MFSKRPNVLSRPNCVYHMSFLQAFLEVAKVVGLPSPSWTAQSAGREDGSEPVDGLRPDSTVVRPHRAATGSIGPSAAKTAAPHDTGTAPGTGPETLNREGGYTQRGVE